MSDDRNKETKSFGEAATLRSFDLGPSLRRTSLPAAGADGSGGSSQKEMDILPKRKSSAFENRGDLVQCPQCPQILRGQLRLLEHICEAHKSEEIDLGDDGDEGQGGQGSKEKIPCPICQKDFSSQSALNAHVRHIHTDVKMFSCGVCGKEFRKKSNLKSHAFTHATQKQCDCQICGKEFSSRRTLKVHLRIHTGERPFSCKFCERSFIQRVHLMRHVAWHIRQGGASRIKSMNESFHESATDISALPIEQEHEPLQEGCEQIEPSPCSSPSFDFLKQTEIKVEPTGDLVMNSGEIQSYLNSRQPSPPSSGSAAISVVTSAAAAVAMATGEHKKTELQQQGGSVGSGCANCALMQGELDLLKVEFGNLKQFLSGKLTLMEQKVDGMKEMLKYS